MGESGFPVESSTNLPTVPCFHRYAMILTASTFQQQVSAGAAQLNLLAMVLLGN